MARLNLGLARASTPPPKNDNAADTGRETMELISLKQDYANPIKWCAKIARPGQPAKKVYVLDAASREEAVAILQRDANVMVRDKAHQTITLQADIPLEDVQAKHLQEIADKIGVLESQLQATAAPAFDLSDIKRVVQEAQQELMPKPVLVEVPEPEPPKPSKWAGRWEKIKWWAVYG